MNKAYNKDDKADSLYFIDTLYALVYASLDSLELQFVSANGTESVKLGVDHMVYFKNGKDEVPIWVNVGHLYDNVFYYSSLWEDANAKNLEIMPKPKKDLALYTGACRSNNEINQTLSQIPRTCRLLLRLIKVPKE